MTWRPTFLRAALGGMLLLGGISLTTGTAQADSCGNRIRNEERELARNIRRYGYYSRQANHERRELNSLRSRCYDGNRWRRRDWDRDDRWRRHHDRDGDHDADRRRRDWNHDRDDHR